MATVRTTIKSKKSKKSRGFAQTGVIAGTTTQTTQESRLLHQKANKVTMGHGVPRQAEGAVGDVTVREIKAVGLRCFIKTNSGWFDIHAMGNFSALQWRPINLNPDIGETTWAHHTDYMKPMYSKDSNGFVHFRGGIRSGNPVTTRITTLPPGFRPGKIAKVPVTTAAANGIATVQITAAGVVNLSDQGNATYTNLDGVSFFAHQYIPSTATYSSSGSGHSGEQTDIGHGVVH